MLAMTRDRIHVQLFAEPTVRRICNMAENPKTNLADLLAEIAASKPATASSHYSYVMGVFEKADVPTASTTPNEKTAPTAR